MSTMNDADAMNEGDGATANDSEAGPGHSNSTPTSEELVAQFQALQASVVESRKKALEHLAFVTLHGGVVESALGECAALLHRNGREEERLRREREALEAERYGSVLGVSVCTVHRWKLTGDRRMLLCV